MLHHTGTHGPAGPEEEAGNNVQAGLRITSVLQVGGGRAFQKGAVA